MRLMFRNENENNSEETYTPKPNPKALAITFAGPGTEHGESEEQAKLRLAAIAARTVAANSVRGKARHVPTCPGDGQCTRKGHRLGRYCLTNAAHVAQALAAARAAGNL